MKHLSWLVTAAALAASSSASALGGLADVAIVDRDSGATLSTYYYRGEYWVAGNPGGRYAIEVRNRSGGRLLAVTAVDGVNVLSGATAGFDQAGYVFDPGESYQITGWRKSNSEVAAFTFTDLPNSYAARTGRAANVGVIGVAVFRERVQRYIPPRITQAPVPGAAEARAQAGDSNQDAAVAGGRAAPAAEAAAKSGEAARRDYLAADSAPAPRLGTGHGERESSVRAGDRVSAPAARAERDHPHPLRQHGQPRGAGGRAARASAAEPPRGLSRLAAAVRARSAGRMSIRRGCLLP